MPRARRKPASSTRERKTLVRGADGALYLLTEKDLAPFKLQEKKAKILTQILEDAREDVVVAELSSSVIKRIQSMNGCVHTGPPEIFLNTWRKE
jgi:hypothetical protein